MQSWRISEALTSIRHLRRVMPDMDQSEVLEALHLESAGLRRKTLLTVLEKRARQLYNPYHHIKELKNGPPLVQNPHSGPEERRDR